MSDLTGQHLFAGALARARARRGVGDLEGALRELRVGMDAQAEFPLATAAAKFLENTLAGGVPPGLPVRRVAVIGADTLDFIRPVIRALAFRDGWWPVFYDPPFGAWRQEILAPHSGLRNFRPELTLIVRSWHSPGQGGVDVGRLVEEELALARCAADGLGLVLWPGYDFPPLDSAMSRQFAEVNELVRASLPPELLWVDLAELQSELGDRWEDERLWEAARQHPSPAGVVVLVERWLASLRARWGQTRKVLVTDLDQVLWGGIVGEDGVAGLRLGPGTLVGEGHAQYQQYLLELKGRGVLLAVCSKNNDADVREVFLRRPMPLQPEDFSGWMVNWNDKAENLRALAVKLRLGLDSFVFVDDQPAERARMRQALPEVAVPELPDDPAGFVAILRSRRFFDAGTVSAEDRGRAAAYRADELREVSRAGAPTLEDFLRGLEMVCEHGPITADELDRAEQLLARTNQWNLTTRRHGRSELTKFIAQPGALTHWFRLRDRYGDHGIVGLWILLPAGAGEWEIDSWVMSCRAIGRGLEDIMFNVLVELARAKGATRLRGIYLPTAKNNLVAVVLPGLGFAPAGNLAESRIQTFEINPGSASLRPHYIRLTEARSGAN